MYSHGFGPGAFLLFAVISLIPVWKIVSKAGFAGAWSLLMLVPLVNIIMLWVFAFSRWPVLGAGDAPKQTGQ
jgi:hypothetical protein